VAKNPRCYRRRDGGGPPLGTALPPRSLAGACRGDADGDGAAGGEGAGEEDGPMRGTGMALKPGLAPDSCRGAYILDAGGAYTSDPLRAPGTTGYDAPSDGDTILEPSREDRPSEVVPAPG
jgi:hypothetical protein